MRKFGKGIAIVLLAALVMTGCGKAKDTKDSEKTEETKTEETADDTAEETADTAGEEAPAEETADEIEETAVSEAAPEGVELIQVDTVNVTGNYYIYEDNFYKNVADYQMEYVLLSDEEKEKYPELAATLEKRGDSISGGVNDEMLSYKEIYEGDKEFYDANDFSMEDKSTCMVVRADSNVLSVVNDWYGYTGGAHGIYGKGGYNYDTKTGEQLKFTDVVLDTDRFFEIANEKISEAFGGYEAVSDVREYVKTLDIDSEISWWIDYQGVTVYFGPYELGSYAMGPAYTTLYFKEYPDLFAAKYTEVPDSYVIPFGTSTSMFLYMDEDNVLDYISVDEIQDSENEWDYQATEIYANGETLTVDEYHYSAENYLVCKEGKFYLVSFRTAEGDYVFARVIDITNMNAPDDFTFATSMAYLGYSYNDGDDGMSTYEDKRATLTDPDNIKISKRTDFLGTMTGTLAAYMDGNGKLVSDFDEMEFFTEYPMQINMDYECKQVDLDGNIVGTVTLPQGSWYLVVRGDGETYADVIEIPANKVTQEDWSTGIEGGRPEVDENSKLYRLEGHYNDDYYLPWFGDYSSDELFGYIFYAG